MFIWRNIYAFFTSSGSATQHCFTEILLKTKKWPPLMWSTQNTDILPLSTLYVDEYIQSNWPPVNLITEFFNTNGYNSWRISSSDLPFTSNGRLPSRKSRSLLTFRYMHSVEIYEFFYHHSETVIFPLFGPWISIFVRDLQN